MFCNSIYLLLMGSEDKSSAVQISTLFWTREYLDSRRVFENRRFRAFKSTHFSDSITSQIFKLWTWSVFWKRAKLCVDFKKILKIEENVCRFWDNGVWTFWGKFCQLSGSYMWSTVNVLTNSTAISDLTDGDVL